MKTLKLISDRLFSTSAAGLYMLLFALAIGAATFIENDFGTSSARKLVFNAWWMELLMALFGGAILVNIFRFRMVQQKKWAVLSFHAAILVILTGAAVTRYFGFEGMMHIREGGQADFFLSSETYLNFEAKVNDRTFRFVEPVYFATLGNNHFEGEYLLGGKEIAVEVTDFMPNPEETLMADPQGGAVLQIVIGGANGREEYYLQEGQRSNIRGTIFNFTPQEAPQAFNIRLQEGKPYFTAPTVFVQTQMATQQTDTLAPGMYHPLRLRSLYSSGNQSFVFAQFTDKARVDIQSSGVKMESSSMAGIKVRVSSGGQTSEEYVYGMPGVEGKQRVFTAGNVQLAIAYGARRIKLPFSLRLRDFILEKYPGTNSASSYASEVTLQDPRSGLVRDQRIYMNHILNYGGYRFFQSSFDQDELGTYLSVNHDWWGTWISYLGYAILTIGMALTFFHKKSRFRQLSENLKAMKQLNKVLIMCIFAAASAWPSAVRADSPAAIPSVSIEHAQRFGLLVMQDHRGRMKPMNTYAGEIVRKLSRKESLFGLNAEQIILSMVAAPNDWYQRPLIKMGKHEKTKALIPASGPLASYADFFDKEGKYILGDHVRLAYNTPEKDRGVFEKEMIKLDEKINICNMVFSGTFFKAFPVPGHSENLWEGPQQNHQHEQNEAATPAQQFFEVYRSALQNGMTSGDWSKADLLVDELSRYQIKNGRAVMPSNVKIKAEIWLNQLNIFSRLGKIYGLLGLAFLGLLFWGVFKPGFQSVWPGKILTGIFFTAFAFHLLGLGLRWYVSGRAPWSNGYESMIYIGFTTTLAGIIFGRKSVGSLAATNILAATILMVAGLSWLDPEITPLVPVLKSYWLTIHVSLEAGSYGFLMLGALIGAINLIFMVFRTRSNADNVNRIIREMTMISEMTLIGGLVMISVGTYLGGVWANESWGRYWGWDAKETWALVTILVYAFILHMRFIPGLKSEYAFNVASLFGWASVIMTYFGVNYYLSGLHSYATGDPAPIPPSIFYAIITLTVISLLAFWRNRQYGKSLSKVHPDLAQIFKKQSPK